MRDVIFIVGTGRTGSSALTRVLSLCGAVLPRRVVHPNFANPTGYWEPESSLAINDRFLRAYRSSWHDESLRLQLDPPQGPEAEQLVEEAAQVLRTGFASHGPIVLKDPRISGLLPYWTAAAERAGLRTAIVQTFRAPAEVAASLYARDAVSRRHSDSLFVKYNLVAERHTRAFPRVFVSYEALLDDWEPLVRRCGRELGVPLAITPEARSAVAAFLSPALRHHAVTSASTADGASLAGRVYALLCEAQAGHVDEPGFDRLFGELTGTRVKTS